MDVYMMIDEMRCTFFLFDFLFPQLVYNIILAFKKNSLFIIGFLKN